MISVRDIQVVLFVDGRRYVVKVCAPGSSPTSVRAAPFDVHIAVGVTTEDLSTDCPDAEVVVRRVLDYVRPLLPASVEAQQLDKLSDVVLAWICQHRAASAARR